MLLVDDFESLADGSPLSDDTNWEVTLIGGSTGVPTMDQHDDHSDGSQVVDMSTTGDAYSLRTQQVGNDDHYVELDVFIDNGQDHQNYFGPIARGSGSTAGTGFGGYGAFAYSTGGGVGLQFHLGIFRIDGEAATELISTGDIGDGAGGSVDTSITHLVRLEVTGSTLTAFLDGVEVLSTTDTTYNIGEWVGFRAYRETGATASQPFVDNFASDVIDPTLPVMAAEHVTTNTTLDQSGNLTSVDSIELDSSGSTDDVGITSRTWTETSGDGGSFDDNTAVAPIYTPAGSGPWTFQVEGQDVDGNTDIAVVSVSVPVVENNVVPSKIGGLFVPSDGSSLADLRTRGPTGSWPRTQDPTNPGTLLNEEHTPSYDTPADTTTDGSFADLQAKVNAASSGDVIEHDGNISGNTLTGGSTSWAKNVLIRPSIGKRADYSLSGDFRVEAAHITVAGYSIEGTIRVRNTTRSGYAWCVANRDSYVVVDAYQNNATDLFLWEIIYAETSAEVDDGDFINSRAVEATLTRPTFYGNYWGGPIRAIGSSAHNDTFQTFSQTGGQILNMLHHSGIYFAAGDKAFQGDSSTTSPIIDNSIVYEPSTSDQWMPYESGHDGLGYHAITGGYGSGGTIRNSTIVGSLGATVTNMQDSILYSANTNQVDNATNVTLLSGNEAPPLLPGDITHEWLDTIWST